MRIVPRPDRPVIHSTGVPGASSTPRSAGADGEAPFDEPRVMTSTDARPPATPPATRVRGPGDLVAAVPALVGFHPQDSLVCVVLGPPGASVRLTARVDLPTHSDTAAWDAVAATMQNAAGQAGGRAAVLVVYSGAPRLADQAERRVGRALRQAGVDVTDVLRVHDGRYYGVACRDERCCPARGRPIPGTSALQARLAVEGRVVVPTRADLAGEIDAPAGAHAPVEGDRARNAVARVSGAVDPPTMARELAAALEEVSSGVLRPDRAVRLAVLAGDGDCRDEVYRHLVAGPVEAHRRLWATVCRAVPGPDSVVPLALFALAAYLEGDGAVANVAWERAARRDPGHPTVGLVGDILAGAVPPSRVVEALAHAVGMGR